MLNIFFPDEYVQSIHHIDYDSLKKRGIKNFIFDIDNTLEPYDIEKPTEKSASLLRKLVSMGFAVLLISNNSKKRVEKFNEELKLPATFRARKPLKSAVLKVMKETGAKPGDTVFIGDQVFTDVCCAKRLHIYVILVMPIANRDEFSVRLKRNLEKKVINKYLKLKTQTK